MLADGLSHHEQAGDFTDPHQPAEVSPMNLIPFPADPTIQKTDRIARALTYRLEASALERRMEDERDVEQSRSHLMHALSLIQLAENEEWLAEGR